MDFEMRLPWMPRQETAVLLRHGPDQDCPAARLPDGARQLRPVGGERRRWRRELRITDAPDPGLCGRGLRQIDEAAELLLPVVPSQVPKSAVSLVPPRQPTAVRRKGGVGRIVAQAGRLDREAG